jgi:hypothetical protein
MRRRTLLTRLAVAPIALGLTQPDPRWNDDELSTIHGMVGRNFEVVRMDGLVDQG